MIKTITLDKEVAASVEQEAQKEERSFSQIINRRLRVAFGIRPPEASRPARKSSRRNVA